MVLSCSSEQNIASVKPLYPVYPTRMASQDKPLFHSDNAPNIANSQASQKSEQPSFSWNSVSSVASTFASRQRDFDDELTLGSLSAQNIKVCLEIEELSRSFSFDRDSTSISDFSLPSPNDVPADIISLWEQVSTHITDPVAVLTPHHEPAHRTSSREALPPPRRYRAFSWISISRRLLVTWREERRRSSSTLSYLCPDSHEPPSSSVQLHFDAVPAFQSERTSPRQFLPAAARDSA